MRGKVDRGATALGKPSCAPLRWRTPWWLLPSALFGAPAEDKDLEDYSPADVAMALCRMVSYNIGQLAYLNAKRHPYPQPLSPLCPTGRPTSLSLGSQP